MKHPNSKAAFTRRTLIASGLIAMGLAVAPSLVQAQTAAISGGLGNFDVVNNTGQDACGFEIEVEGLDPTKVVGSFTAQRYGVATVSAYTTGLVSGTRVSWKSADCTTNKTIAHAPGTGFAGTCYQWYPATYQNAGCEHFGLYFTNTAVTTITSRWLVNDPANVGAYIPHDPPMPIATPYYYVQPAVVANAAAVVANAAPVVVAEVVAPEPPEAPGLFGRAQWMKVFKRQLPVTVTLDQLVTDNPLVVPMDPALTEVNWTVVQADPPNGNAKRNRNRQQGNSTLDPTTRSVVRRYELYAYTGATDPVTGEVLCADLLCNTPAATELGDFISAQMTAVNVQGDFITVTKAGSGGGNVDSTDKLITCGNKCVMPYKVGSTVTLTAKANSGSAFAGWTGACTGTGNCTVTINGANTVTATFNTQVAAGGGGGGGGTGSSNVTLKVSTGNPGVVTSDVGGINCGTACSASVASGTAITLTATPPAGKTFGSWTGACTGTATTCTVTVNANLSVKANFNK